MLLPIRSKNPPESLPIATVALVVINVAIYAATSDGFTIKETVLNEWGLKGSNFDLAHMVSSMFLHGGLLHLIGNMWFLYLFGFAVEGRLKTLKFVILYFLAGFCGDLLHQVILGATHADIPSIGASGAIMGVLGAALYLFPHAKVTFVYGFSFRWGTFDCPMWGVGLIYLGMDILFALIGMKDGVGHFAHIGGAAGGFLICALLRPKRDSETVSQAKATLSETKDLRTLSRAELAELHKVQPDDTTIALNWMHRSLRDPMGVRPECQAAFVRLLPKMMKEHEVGTIAQCLPFVLATPGAVKPTLVADIAQQMERLSDNTLALRLYETVLADPNSREGDLEVATYRIGILCESAFSNYARAYQCYEEVARRWPMSPFAEQAKVRMAIVLPKVPPVQAATDNFSHYLKQ